MERSALQGSPEDVARRNQELFEKAELEKQKMLDLIKSKGIVIGGKMTVYRVEPTGNTGEAFGIHGTMRIPSRVFYCGVANEVGVGAVLLTEREGDTEGDERRGRTFTLGAQEITVEAGWDERVPTDL